MVLVLQLRYWFGLVFASLILVLVLLDQDRLGLGLAARILRDRKTKTNFDLTQVTIMKLNGNKAQCDKEKTIPRRISRTFVTSRTTFSLAGAQTLILLF
jgi:hypothetical protein